MCSIDGCEMKIYARGWCRNHYTRWQRRKGDPSIKMISRGGSKRRLGVCEVDGCSLDARAKGKCKKHYAKSYKRVVKLKEGYDNNGRLKYNPELHPNQGKTYSVSELSYICKNYIPGHVKALALKVGRTEGSIREAVKRIRKDGMFDYYKMLNKTTNETEGGK